jgi:AraC family transcriptional regulator
VNPHGESNEAPGALLSRLPPKGQSIVASTATAGWDDLHGVILEGRVEDFFDLAATCTLVAFILKGEAQLDWRRANRFTRQGLRPGDVLVAPPGPCNRMRTGHPIEVFCHWIGRGRLAAIVGREWPHDPSGFEIVEGLHRDDEGLWDLGRRLADLIREPVPGSRSYAEALQTQIAVHLLWHHSSLARPADEAEGVDDPRLGPVIRYIRENLAEDVSLETLAGVAGLSPNYFLGAFREATGRTPHRYVTELRVARACELLRDPHRPIPEVSLAVGFSSQSHLTEVFRRTLKTTPAAYRRDVLRLARNGDDADP